MAEQLKRQKNLTVLRVYLSRTNRNRSPDDRSLDVRVVFSLEHRGETRQQFEVDFTETGLPPNPDSARRYSDNYFSIPSYLVDGIRQELIQIGHFDGNTPLWLEIANPAGSLPLVPWEQLLQPSLGVPILRLPYFSLKPVSSAGRWNIVLCASEPRAKAPFDLGGLLNDLVDIIPNALERFITLHVFADRRAYESLKNNANLLSPNLILHDPAEASRYGAAERIQGIHDTLDNLESPWLRWIIDSLAGESADVVHFLCHGYLSMGQGALALAESPLLNRDPMWARFVGPQQLGTFLTQIGAWSVGFSSPPNNFSAPGLRLLADQISHLRPGAVFLHDVTRDPQCSELSSAYHFLYNESPEIPQSLSAISLYCHPSRVRQIAEQLDDTDQSEILREFTLARTGGILRESRDRNLPAWIATNQRYLEQSAAQLLERLGESETETQAATRRGTEKALRSIAETIELYGSGPPIP